ncbi:MAG: AI-2E family transporter [Acidimicrobiia bacterium]|nr:AI-2E family transporter [Acidimicrobiia bacterium]
MIATTVLATPQPMTRCAATKTLRNTNAASSATTSSPADVAVNRTAPRRPPSPVASTAGDSTGPSPGGSGPTMAPMASARPEPPPGTGTASGTGTPSAPGPLRLEVDILSVAYLVGAILVTLAVLGLFQAAPSSITKVAVGVLLAAALDPLVVRARRSFRWTRTAAVALVSTVLVGTFTAIAVLLAPPAIQQAEDLTTELPETVQRTYSWPVVGSRLEAIDAAAEVERFIDELPGRLDDDTVGAAVEAAIGGAQTLALVLITAVAVLLDGETLIARGRRLIRPARRPRADEVGRIVYRTVGNYFAGSLLVAFLNGLVILTVGLLLGVPLAPLAAIWAMLTNLIPQIGGLLGGSFFVVLAVTQGPLVGLIALATFLVYQQVENNVVQPAVVGRAVNLSPPATMVAALIGGAAAGVPGALAATPFVGTVKAIYLELRRGPPAPETEPGKRRLGGGRAEPRTFRRRQTTTS